MIRAIIGGVEYGQDKIASCRIIKNLFSKNTLSVGGVASAQIEITLINPGDIPRGAKIELFVDDIQQGIFWIDTRTNNFDGSYDISGYDAMLKTEQAYFVEGDAGEWPRKMPNVVQEIATKIGVEVDERTSVGNYDVEFTNDFTMREVLSYIAAANAGNWLITKQGKLYLAGIVLPPTTNYLITEDGDPISFGGVRILV